MKRLVKFPDPGASKPGSRDEAQVDGGNGAAGGRMWSVNPGDYEAVLDNWLDGTALRGRPWTGVSSDAPFNGGMDQSDDALMRGADGDSPT